jgi:Ca2+-binding EF-hand superfamily protein
MSKSLTTDQITKVKKSFAMHDVDNSGFVTVAEYKKILGEYSDYFTQEDFNEVDSDHDGKVSYAEFLKSYGG